MFKIGELVKANPKYMKANSQDSYNEYSLVIEYISSGVDFDFSEQDYNELGYALQMCEDKASSSWFEDQEYIEDRWLIKTQDLRLNPSEVSDYYSCEDIPTLYMLLHPIHGKVIEHENNLNRVDT